MEADIPHQSDVKPIKNEPSTGTGLVTSTIATCELEHCPQHVLSGCYDLHAAVWIVSLRVLT